jgi:hypothetical protein
MNIVHTDIVPLKYDGIYTQNDEMEMCWMCLKVQHSWIVTSVFSQPDSVFGSDIPVVWSNPGINEACNAVLTQLHL